jgi:hypothetical protein
MEATTATTTYRPGRGEPPRETRGVEVYEAEVEGGPAVPATAVETIGIFGIFAVGYALLGYHVVVQQHVVVFDAVDRLTRAFMVWYNDPAKLAAIGFTIPPISTLVLMPFAAVRSLVTSGIALPLSAGIFGGAALTFINRMFAAADMSRGARWALVLIIAINPMFAFYAMNGVGDMTYVMFISFGLFCMVAWARTLSARYLIGAGIAFGLACLTRYEFIFWSLWLALVFGGALAARQREALEIEGSIVAFLAPVVYAVGLWIFFNSIVLGKPFDWVTSLRTEPVNAAVTPVSGFDLGTAIGNVLRIELIFPLTLLMVPLLLFNLGGGTRGPISVGIAGLIVLSMAYLVIGAASAGRVDTIELHDALPAMMAGIAGIAWLYFSAEDFRGPIWGMAMIGGLLALPLAWNQMQDFPHQNLEQAFTRAISTGDDQEGTSSRGGFRVGIAPEREAANYIDGLHLPNTDVLTDNARTFGVIGLSGNPETFFDRVDRGDAQWQAVLSDPVGKVDYMLVERSPADLILRKYPGADEGQVDFLEPVVSNQTYSILRVAGPAQAATTGTAANAGTTGTAPTGTSGGATGQTTQTTP